MALYLGSAEAKRKGLFVVNKARVPAQWTPDQQRTTPQERRAAPHPGHANSWSLLTK
jgi:hypothetical protein